MVVCWALLAFIKAADDRVRPDFSGAGAAADSGDDGDDNGYEAFSGYDSAVESPYDDRDEFERWFDEENAKQHREEPYGKGGAEE